MPLYDYQCRAHGLFSELATVDEAALPSPCPTCREPARRVIAVPRAVLNRNSAEMRAHAINERSQHEPRATVPGQPEACGHDHRRPRALYTREGNKIFPSMRPWMISH